MTYEQVFLDNVVTEGPEAGKFSFSFDPGIDELAHSIQMRGIARPPILRETANGYQVVCGHKRVLACVTLGMKKIGALICRKEAFSDERCLWLSLLDNDCPARLSTVEKAIALSKFSALGYSPERLASHIAPHLELPASENYIRNYLRLLELETDLLHALHERTVGVEQAFCLLDLDPESRSVLFRVLVACRANLNETRELLSLIQDVAALRHVSAPELVDAEINSTLEDSSIPPRSKLERIRAGLLQARYPRLCGAQSEFEAIARKLSADKGCRIRAPKFFEGDEISVEIRSHSDAGLAETLQRLSDPDARAEFRKLFDLLRGHTTT